VIPWLPFERRWRDALFAAMLPRLDPDGPPGLGELDLASFWPRFHAAAPPLLRLGLRAAVWAFAFAPLFLRGRLCFFSGLPEGEQDAVLLRAAGHRRFLLRQMALVVKAVACFAYFQDPSARAAVEAGRRA
jgi:hypothetical protein